MSPFTKAAAGLRVKAAVLCRQCGRHRDTLVTHGSPLLVAVAFLVICLLCLMQPGRGGEAYELADPFCRGTCPTMETFFKGGYKLCMPPAGADGEEDSLTKEMLLNHRNNPVQERLLYSLVRCPLCLSRIHAESHLVLDVGAHVGWFSMWAASVGTTNIHAFEASAAHQQLIRRSIDANRFEEEITLWPVALAARTEVYTVHTFVGNSGAAFLSKEKAFVGRDDTTPAGTTVTARLDALFPAEQSIWLMKISVTGMEDVVMEGMMAFLTRPLAPRPEDIASGTEPRPRVHNILLDCNPFPEEGVVPGRKDSANLLEHLVAQGYHLYSIKHDWDFWVDGMENLGHGIDQQKLITDLLTPFAPNKAITITEFQVVFCTLTVNLKELDVTQVELDYVKTLYTK